MNKYDEFLNEIRQLNIEVTEYRYLNGAGWLSSKHYPELPKGLKKDYKWKLTPSNEDELRRLQSGAVNELALLSDGQIQKQLKRLDFINDFDRFFDFIKQFYVKYEKDNYTGLDISDFKMKLESCFYCDIPEKGNLDIEFLDELMNELIFKSAIFDGLKHQLEQLAPQPKPKKNTPTKVTLKDFFNDEVNTEIIETIQDKFMDLEGKKMAVLIYLLNKKHKIINIDNNDRKKFSRSHFVRCLKDDPNFNKITAIGNYFKSITGELKKIDKKDTAYKNISEQLSKIVSSV